MKYLLLIPALCIEFLGLNCPKQHSSSYKEYAKISSSIPVLSHKNLFKSHNGRLDIKINAKKFVSFIDVSPDSDETNSKKYTYLGYIDVLHGFIVHEMGYEVGSIIMITQNGKRVKLWSIPYVSQDGKTAVCLSQGVETPLLPNGLQVLHLKNGEITNICTLKVSKYEPLEVKWIDSQRFIVKFQTLSENGVTSNKFIYNTYEL